MLYLTALQEGLLYGLLALGVYISLRVLDIPDLTTEGSFGFGSALAAVLAAGGHTYLSLPIAFLGGMAAGLITGLLQTKLQVHPVLAGIITMSGLYSVNLIVRGGPNLSIGAANLFKQFYKALHLTGDQRKVAGALLAKEVAKRVPTVDYPLLIASAYSGFVIWHAGLSGSIPLTLVTGAKFGEVTYQAAITETIFHPMNIVMCCVILLVMPFVNYAMHPDRDHAITIDPTLLQDEEDKTYEVKTPADKMEHSRILWIILVVAGFAYIIYYFATLEEGKNIASALNLNIVNFIFLFLGILLHGDLRRYVDAISDAAGGAAGVLLQFPFYAGIMGMMVVQNEAGVSLAGVISQFFVNISNNVTFPMLSFLAAGIVNFFVPSGGGQWAVQGPIMMPAGAELDIGAGRTAMAIAWGDQWTNMIQPFWALPALGIAKLSARDIMGYLVVVLLFVGLVACLGFLAWGLLF